MKFPSIVYLSSKSISNRRRYIFYWHDTDIAIVQPIYDVGMRLLGNGHINKRISWLCFSTSIAQPGQNLALNRAALFGVYCRHVHLFSHNFWLFTLAMYLSLNTYICICLTDRSKSFVVLFGVKQAANSVFLTHSHSFARLHAILMQMFVYVPATTVHVQPKSPRIWLCCSFLSAVSWLNKYESHEPNTELLHTYARNIFFFTRTLSTNGGIFPPYLVHS